MRKAGRELTKTRGVDPKRVSPNEAAGQLLVERALEAMEKEYHPDIPIAIFLPIRDLVTIGQALTSCENNRKMWAAGLRAVGPHQSIARMRCTARSIWKSLERSGVGYPAAKMTGKRGEGPTDHCAWPIVASRLFRPFQPTIRSRKACRRQCISPTGLTLNWAKASRKATSRKPFKRACFDAKIISRIGRKASDENTHPIFKSRECVTPPRLSF